MRGEAKRFFPPQLLHWHFTGSLQTNPFLDRRTDVECHFLRHKAQGSGRYWPTPNRPLGINCIGRAEGGRAKSEPAVNCGLGNGEHCNRTAVCNGSAQLPKEEVAGKASPSVRW